LGSGNYALLDRVPDETGALTQVIAVDVLQIVPIDVGPDAVDRIIHERYLNPDHPYTAPKPPCIAQYTRDSERYVIQRINDPANGVLDGNGRGCPEFRGTSVAVR